MLSDDTLLEFIQEGYLLLNQFSQNLQLLMDNPSNSDAIGDAFRALHTIKGNSGFAGLSGTYYLFQYFTDYFRPVYDKKLDLSEKMLENFQKFPNIIKNILDNLNDGKNLKKDDAILIINQLGLGLE
jgi:two-component system chemotaxis sensor kinase CheA